ncbi:uncharacterized protein LOC120321195 [Drosophila yakuba]|uniref:Seminal fluid protein 53E n=1 Tax=Drosophila yakuba TaxID=7245 RepID=C4NAQ5_DROYA|nr:uncharacterized protein LOC120321195 [Drosophila yakuba]ACQ73739.1 seminal fluid protein 53E [Drosophila yakuba]
MDHLSLLFLIICLMSVLHCSTAPTHPDCGPAGRCYTVNSHFGSFRQTRCVPCKRRRFD